MRHGRVEAITCVACDGFLDERLRVGGGRGGGRSDGAGQAAEAVADDSDVAADRAELAACEGQLRAHPFDIGAEARQIVLDLIEAIEDVRRLRGDF